MIRMLEIEGHDPLFDEVEKLIKEVFPSMDLAERLSFLAYRHQSGLRGRILAKLSGVSSLSNIWAAINDNKEICGTTGIYTCADDAHEADWLSWFCVAPNQRGQGISKKLIEFSIDLARKRSKKFLRLYTSDDPNEAVAQLLYERYGLKVVKTEKYSSGTIIYRELKL